MRTHITKYQRTSRPRYLFALILVLALGLLAGCTQDLPLGSILSQDRAADASASEAATSPAFDLGSIPPNDGKGYVELNGGQPTFTDADKALPYGYESYAPLDSLGRCGAAMALVGVETIPEPGSKRQNISKIHPSGWEQARYDFIPGEALYNRSHLIARELTAEEANPNNLITGTQYMNQSNMRPFEDAVRNFIDLTGYHVLFRATPIFQGDELVARGVQLEAWSLEDEGDGICLNVYCYNEQPGVTIDYATGVSWL